LTTTHARLPAPQDRTVGRNRGHPWGETVATSGAIQWPPTGRFSWPPSCGTSPPPRGANPRKALHTGGQAKQSPLPAAVEATTRMTYRQGSRAAVPSAAGITSGWPTNFDHEQRFQRIVAEYLERPAGEYAELLLHRGYVTSPCGVDPEEWRADIRAQARQDKPGVRHARGHQPPPQPVGARPLRAGGVPGAGFSGCGARVRRRRSR